MKSEEQNRAGGARRSDRKARRLGALTSIGLLAFAAVGSAPAQTLYKYQGDDGEWIYADRPPVDGDIAEIRTLASGADQPALVVRHDNRGDVVELIASNRYHAPIELRLDFEAVSGIAYPDPDMEFRWILPPLSETMLVSLPLRPDDGPPRLQYDYEYLVGDPDATHRPAEPYRVPVASADNFPITQAYPDVVTHTTPDSWHAVDIAMPIGTDIFATRAGVVFDVAADNYLGGTDPERHLPAANYVRILHDDGTYAVYAHLNWNSIRVRPGDRVARGEYIAESGNTGYSTGPHLHFAVLKNVGMRAESLPVEFSGVDARVVAPATGRVLTAH